MGSTKEIQTRMKSIQDTMKITNAMYMISSSKMQKAKRILSDTEPYYYNMQAAISRILRHMPDTEHPFFMILCGGSCKRCHGNASRRSETERDRSYDTKGNSSPSGIA